MTLTEKYKETMIDKAKDLPQKILKTLATTAVITMTPSVTIAHEQKNFKSELQCAALMGPALAGLERALENQKKAAKKAAKLIEKRDDPSPEKEQKISEELRQAQEEFCKALSDWHDNARCNSLVGKGK